MTIAATPWRTMLLAAWMASIACTNRVDDTSDGGGSSAASSTATSTTTGDSATTSPTTTSPPTTSATTAVDTTADGSGSDTSSECPPRPLPNPEYLCCDGAWVDPRSDQFNCGGCGIACDGDTPFCDQGTCGVPACLDVTACGADEVCCGSQCCAPGMTCCTINGPVQAGPECVQLADDATCPAGCAPLCQCAAADTPIATPFGDRPIAALAVGDLVYSVDDGQTTIVPILSVQRVAVHDHRVVRAVLDDGRVVRISASHPLADGRGFGDLRAGERFGSHAIVRVDAVDYDAPQTYDILPASSSGAYFVAGELVASTMAPLSGLAR